MTAVEMDRIALDRTRELLSDSQTVDEEGSGVEFADGSFDVIVASDLSGTSASSRTDSRPVETLAAADGRLITTFRSVRSLPVVEGLLAGRWVAGAGSRGRRIRFFTRREVEKLLYRTGYAIELISVQPGLGHAEWVARGRPGEVKVGQLHIGGLHPADVEEFYAREFLVEATPAAVPDFGLTSIIVVTFNQLEYTRQCVESIRRMTDERYELIFVDNASTDGTDRYLHSVSGAKVIVNDENRGFPAAVNQGIEVATGQQILLLNNDTIVTTGWLRRLSTPQRRQDRSGRSVLQLCWQQQQLRFTTRHGRTGRLCVECAQR